MGREGARPGVNSRGEPQRQPEDEVGSVRLGYQDHLDALPERDAAIRERLAAAAPIEEVFHGAAFRFPAALPRPAHAADPTDPAHASDGAEVLELRPGDARLGGPFEADFPSLAANLPACGPCFAALEDGRVVSVCYAATKPAPWVEAGVETLPGFRGRGLASRVVATWARGLRARGSVPLYSASLDNRSSLRVARRLGLIRYGTDLHMR